MIYMPGSSLLHRLHPLTKLVLALLLVVAVNLFRWPFFPSIILAIVLTMALASGIASRLLRVTLQVLLPITISLFIIQGVLFPPADAVAFATLGPIRLTYAGFEFAFVVATRLLALSAIVLMVVLTTHPADLTMALAQIGLPRSIGYVLLVALQIVPEMSMRATGILEAQQSRGLNVRRGVARVLAFPALVGPLVVGALADVEERAMALESRAFADPGPKTSLRTLVDTPGQRIGRWLMLLLIVGLIVLRFTLLRGVL